MFKNFILNLGFVRKALDDENRKAFERHNGTFALKTEEVYQMAFKHAREDLEETNVYDVEERAKEVSRETISKLLGIFNEKLVITYDKKTGSIFVGGERLDEPRILALKQEAEFISNTDLWKIMSSSLNSVTRQVMFEKSESFDDMKNGKSILYTLSFQTNILKIFQSYQHKVSKTTNNMV